MGVRDGNEFIGIIRFFHSDATFEAIIFADNSYFDRNLDENKILWKRPNEEIHQNFVFQNKDKSRVTMIMIYAKSVEVIGEICNEEGIKIIEIASTNSSQSYHFERLTIDSYGDQPFILEPLDSKYINISSSTMNSRESSQENIEYGAFAQGDIPHHTVIAHNNGKISN